MCRSPEPSAPPSSTAPTLEVHRPEPHSEGGGSENRGSGEPPAAGAPPGSASSVLDAYQTALVRLFLAVIDGLARDPTAGVPCRAVVNFLRGNQRPPATLRDAGLLSLFGVLARCPAAWIREIVGRLIESGEVLEGDGKSSGSATPGRIRLSRWGSDLLRGPGPVSIDVLPRPTCLGANPELEAGLWDLRRRLAEKEGRAPFSIFSNSTLAALASIRPRDLGELAGIPGFGEARIRKYGEAVLEALRGEQGQR